MLSSFQISKEKREELQNLYKQVKETPLVQIIDYQHPKRRLSSAKGEKIGQTHTKQYVNETYNVERSSLLTIQSLPLVKQALIKKENHKKEKEIKLLQHFKRQVYVWFYNESLRPRQTQQPPSSKRTFMQPTITIKSDKKEGIQVSGTILTRDGYKITYPNIHNIIKMSSLWEEENKTIILRSCSNLRVSNHLDLQDQFDELKGYVWKIKVYHNFFKLLLKHSVNNIEIKKVLVKVFLQFENFQVAEALGTSINHVHLFYQLSSKPWAIPGMIKDLNNKNLTNRERKEWLNQLLVNIQEDLIELFLDEQGSYFIPSDEQFIGFDRYVTKLQEMVRKRVKN